MNSKTISISLVPTLLVTIASTIIIYDQNRTIKSLLKKVTTCYDSLSEDKRIDSKWNMYLLSELTRVKKELYSMTEIVVILEKQMYESKHQYVTVTSYHPPTRGINSDKNPNKTAVMRKPKAGRTLALSEELIRLGWIGKKIYITGWGVGVGEDKNNMPGKLIDICAPTLKWAKKFGKRQNVLAIVID